MTSWNFSDRMWYVITITNYNQVTSNICFSELSERLETTEGERADITGRAGEHDEGSEPIEGRAERLQSQR